MLDVLKYRTVCALFSLVLISSFVGMYIYKEQTRGYAFSYSVDFDGGTEVLFKFDQSMSAAQLKSVLVDAGWAGPVIRKFSDQEVIVRVKDYSNDSQGLAEKMRQLVEKKYPENPVMVLKSEAVGPGVGADLRWKSIRAVIFALLAMLAYIAFRFWSFAFAFGAVVALFHDALIMLAVFLFLDRDISVNVIAAILAVIGYSINDTIVIFAQIRDNLKTGKRVGSLKEIVNESINHTLKRTILTSVSTALTVGSMFVLGGEALKDFSLALLVGIVFGTYSSIFIASPVMMLLHKDK